MEMMNLDSKLVSLGKDHMVFGSIVDGEGIAGQVGGVRGVSMPTRVSARDWHSESSSQVGRAGVLLSRVQKEGSGRVLLVTAINDLGIGAMNLRSPSEWSVCSWR